MTMLNEVTVLDTYCDHAVGVDAEGNQALVNWEDGAGWVSCGEEIATITSAQMEGLVRGDISILCAIFNYADFETV